MKTQCHPCGAALKSVRVDSFEWNGFSDHICEDFYKNKLQTRTCTYFSVILKHVFCNWQKFSFLNVHLKL